MAKHEKLRSCISYFWRKMTGVGSYVVYFLVLRFTISGYVVGTDSAIPQCTQGCT